MSVVFDLGEISLFGWGALRGFFTQRSRLVKLTQGIHEIGVRCFPIIATVGLFTGLVMGLQLYYTLVKFGAESALGTAVALSLIRELGPVLTAQHHAARLTFAREHLGWQIRHWRPVLFIDHNHSLHLLFSFKFIQRPSVSCWM